MQCTSEQGCGDSGDSELSSSLTHGRSSGLKMEKSFPRACSRLRDQLLGQLPALNHTPSVPQPHRRPEKQAQPGGTRFVCFTRQRWGSDTDSRGSQGWHSPSLTTGGDLTHDRHYSAITGAETYILTPIKSQLISQIDSHSNCHNYYIIETSTKHIDCSLLTSSTVGFAACIDLWYTLLLLIIHSLEIQQSVTIIPDYNV